MRHHGDGDLGAMGLDALISRMRTRPAISASRSVVRAGRGVYTGRNAGHPHHDARLSAPCPPHRSNLAHLLLDALPHAQLVAVSRFDRRPPERDSTRINERIRVPEVRLIDENGEQVGIVPTPEALERAREKDLDLVEVSPTSKPPVCRILDYSKYKYEQEQKAKQARKHQQQTNVREIKLRPKIAQHDYETKRGHVERFLKQQDKVKVTIMFRGREQSHPEGAACCSTGSSGRLRDRRHGAAASAGGPQYDDAARPGAGGGQENQAATG